MTCACSAEKRALDRMQSDLYETLREAAEVHRTVRKYAQSIIRPGIVLADMCEQIENLNRALVKEDGLNVSARRVACAAGAAIAVVWCWHPASAVFLRFFTVLSGEPLSVALRSRRAAR